MRFDDLPKEWASGRINAMSNDELRAMNPVELQCELSALLDEQSQRVVAAHASQIRGTQNDRWAIAIDSARIRVRRYMAALDAMSAPVKAAMSEVRVLEDVVIHDISLVPANVYGTKFSRVSVGGHARIKPEYHSGGDDDA